MTLTVGGCVRLWTSVQTNRPQPWEGRHNCLGCPVGAWHADRPVAEAARARAIEALRKFCPRCLRSASRLINGAFCVSCYNRTREMAKGRNAKGNPPREVAARLHAVTLAVTRESIPVAVERHEAVTSRAEAMVRAARAAAGRVSFGPPHLSLIAEAVAP